MQIIFAIAYMRDVLRRDVIYHASDAVFLHKLARSRCNCVQVQVSANFWKCLEYFFILLQHLFSPLGMLAERAVLYIANVSLYFF